MKHFSVKFVPNQRRALTCIFALALLVAVNLYGAKDQRTFATPEEASTALANAVSASNLDELGAIFGPEAAAIENPDPVQGANEFAKFSAALIETNFLVSESVNRRVLILGHEAWPFPVPIVQKGGRWFFDTAAGLDELINRRIGRSELETIKVLRAYVEAQREYASRERDNDEVLEYAQKIVSSPGAKDGLFWSPEIDGEISPLGPLAADAAIEGYRKVKQNPSAGRQPFHGYFFKILTRQGKHPAGGKYNYVINGNMIGGFAMVAWPAEYGESGIMTFLVNQQGRVYQKHLGPKTAKLAEAMTTYDPDFTWQLVP